MNVLLLHPLPLDARVWEGHREALAAAGHAVAAPDLGAAGASLGAWAESVLATAPERFAAVGVSMGGYLAFELWRRAPERIAALVLADTRATPEADPAGRDELIRVAREEGAEALWERMRGALLSERAGPEAVERARELAAGQPPERLVAALTAIRDRPDSRPTLPTIGVPALVLVGEDDALTPPEDARTMAAAIPGARLEIVSGSGHLLPLERPEEFRRLLLDFLAGVE